MIECRASSPHRPRRRSHARPPAGRAGDWHRRCRRPAPGPGRRAACSSVQYPGLRVRWRRSAHLGRRRRSSAGSDAVAPRSRSATSRVRHRSDIRSALAPARRRDRRLPRTRVPRTRGRTVARRREHRNIRTESGSRTTSVFELAAAVVSDDMRPPCTPLTRCLVGVVDRSRFVRVQGRAGCSSWIVPCGSWRRGRWSCDPWNYRYRRAVTPECRRSAPGSALGPRCWPIGVSCPPISRSMTRSVRWAERSHIRSGTATAASAGSRRWDPKRENLDPGDLVFAFHPHQERFVIAASELVPMSPLSNRVWRHCCRTSRPPCRSRWTPVSCSAKRS